MNRNEFNEYVRMNSRKLYSFAFRILRNQEESEDAVQETFIKLWNMGEKLNEYNSIDALSTTMIRNHCIDQVRKRKNIIQSHSDSFELESFTVPSPHQQMEDTESYNIIRTIMTSMPDKYKNILKLREIDGLSYEEIAAETNQNINNLRVLLSRARVILKEEYNKYDNEKRGNKQVTRKVL
jgi:RNA polymerase sigma factor (sigma-70 family)